MQHTFCIHNCRQSKFFLHIRDVSITILVVYINTNTTKSKQKLSYIHLSRYKFLDGKHFQ